jgi:hypothetical protein
LCESLARGVPEIHRNALFLLYASTPGRGMISTVKMFLV